MKLILLSFIIPLSFSASAQKITAPVDTTKILTVSFTLGNWDHIFGSIEAAKQFIGNGNAPYQGVVLSIDSLNAWEQRIGNQLRTQLADTTKKHK